MSWKKKRRSCRKTNKKKQEMKISRQLPDGSEDWVYNTAIYSASCQIVLGLISLFGFIKTPTPKTQILRPLLVIDLLVQLIEFSFYTLFICYKKLDTWYRYIDWFFSTPLLFIIYYCFFFFFHFYFQHSFF